MSAILPALEAETPMRPPSKLLLLSEWRWIYELSLSLATFPALATAKKGDGHPVLVLPGFLTGDSSTYLLRRFLALQNFEPFKWELGRNLGGVYSMRKKLRARLLAIREETGRRVSVLGWSLGGVYARDLALAMPDDVRYCITLGSPFTSDLAATNAGHLYEKLSGESLATVTAIDRTMLAGPLPMPTASFYTRTDGIVNWHLSRVVEDAHSENVEVLASHLGLGVNPAVLWGVADRLAQAEGTFHAFDRSGPYAFAYPHHADGDDR